MRPELPILIKARALIADPAKWGKGTRYRDRDGDTCCATEALEEVFDFGPDMSPLYSAFARLRQAAEIDGFCMALPRWNDAPERTHADVLAAFDKAIASAS